MRPLERGKHTRARVRSERTEACAGGSDGPLMRFADLD
jgi:hypothetical protein